jgi:hypothetical protein
MASEDYQHRRCSDQEIEQAVIALLAEVNGTGEIRAHGRKPWSHADTNRALGYTINLLLEFARCAEHDEADFAGFLRRKGLDAALQAEVAEPLEAPQVRGDITLADDDGAILLWIRVTADGRLDAGGDTSRWTGAARSFITELRRQAAAGPG